MAIAAPCPECHTKLKVGDDRAGEEVECPRCGATFTAPDTPAPAPAPARRPARDDEDDEPPRKSRPASPKPTGAPRRRRRDDDDDDYEHDHPRRKSKAAGGSNSGVVIALIAVVAFVVVGAVVGFWAASRKKETASSSAPSSSMPGPGIGMGPNRTGSNNFGKIEGTKWRSLQGWVKGNNIPAGALRLEFNRDGSLVYHTPTGEYRGTYTLSSGDDVVWNFTRALGGSNRHEQRVSINGNRMSVHDTDGTTLDFEPEW